MEKGSESRKNILMTLRYYFIIFIIGSLIGWIYEEFFYYFTEGILENRGFLYGPYLPVYGFGAVLMLIPLRKIKRYPIIVFFSIILLTGVLEYITGFIMWQIWHERWWDYTGLFMNIDGYVCLRSVLTFAIGGIGLIYLIDPFLRNHMYHVPYQDKLTEDSSKKSPRLIPDKTLNWVCIAILIIILVDAVFAFTVRHPIL